MQIEVYHREQSGWMLYPAGPSSIVKLRSLDIQIPIEDIYENVYCVEQK
ncbi:hypothetical protein [Ktedonosporobacter rubrisoli]|nr:hypothetical protein [Ktedonosporobacter rubrisoli]